MARGSVNIGKGNAFRAQYVVGDASIWYVDAGGGTCRADPEEVIALDAGQARHFRDGLKPYIPEEEIEEEIETGWAPPIIESPAP